MSKVMHILRQAGFSELACQFAAYIERIDTSQQQIVSLTAGVLSETVSQGHVCLNLANTAFPPEWDSHLPEDILVWRRQLLSSNVVGQEGDFAPLILTERNQLYLYRHWQDEVDVAAAMIERSQQLVSYEVDKVVASFVNWHSDVDGVDWQKVAVLSALTQSVTVISGGPGTGKTTIVKRILAALKSQDATLNIALAAPTGKAAARLQQAVQSDQQAVEAKTLHRLLGITSNNEQGRYSTERPLPVDVLIVDEASMIDISLMAVLLKALPAHARLIILGDSQQLASVESGAVLANLCDRKATFSADYIALAKQCDIEGLAAAKGAPTLSNQVVKLQQSYRFSADSEIAQLAEAVNLGDAEVVQAVLSAQSLQLTADDASLELAVMKGYASFINAVEMRQQPDEIMVAFESFRVLAAINKGPQSVASVNKHMANALGQRGWRTQQDFYHGRPILITQNDYRQQLFNGDIGVVLFDERGQLQVCFCFDGTVRWVPITRLPAHQTAFAMSVHKSQGSEFDSVVIVLPSEFNPVLCREWLYTALTRAKQHIQVYGVSAIISQTVMKQHSRESGLSDLLDA